MSDAKGNVGAICLGWWAGAIIDKDNHNPGRARMTRARLRRADGPVAALAVAAVHDLNARLRAAGFEPAPDRLALIAAALAQVAEGQGPRAAQAFGKIVSGAAGPGIDSKEKRHIVSAIRFNTLIRARTMGELWRPLLRALRMVKGQVNAAALAEDIFYWSDERRTRWCFDYYGSAFAVPKSEETTT